MISTETDDNHFAYRMDMACYVKLRMATTAHRNWLTPYEILRGVKPSIAHFQPFFTKAYVQAPKTKRAKMKDWVSRINGLSSVISLVTRIYGAALRKYCWTGTMWYTAEM